MFQLSVDRLPSSCFPVIGELALIMRDKARSRHSPSGTNAKQLCLEAAAHGAFCTIVSEKVEHRARNRQYDEAVALLPSFLQGHASIDTVSWVFPRSMNNAG